MKEVQRNDLSMTTGQIAEVLSVSKQAVRDRAKQLFPDKPITPGVPTLFDETEVTEISKAFKQNPSPNSQVNLAVTTELEIIQNAATAMAQLQSLIQQKALEVKKLQIELDQSKAWWTVKRVLIETGREYPWRPLKKYSLEHGYEIQKAFDKNYDEVSAYHVDVWHDVYGLEL